MGKEARFKQGRLRNAYCFIRWDLLLKGCWLSISCLYLLRKLVDLSGNEGQSNLPAKPCKAQCGCSTALAGRYFSQKRIRFGSPMHWTNVLTTRYNRRPVPVAAVCGKTSSPVSAGISGQVLCGAFVFLSVVAGSCVGLSCLYRSFSASENTPGNSSSCIKGRIMSSCGS